MPANINLNRYLRRINKLKPIKMYGSVVRVKGLLIESVGPPTSIGDLCFIKDKKTNTLIKAEVVGFKENIFYLMPYRNIQGISPGSQIYSLGVPLNIDVGDGLKGRVVNGIGEPIDDKGEIYDTIKYPIIRGAPPPMKRKRIDTPLRVGIKAIDGCLTIGRGQRVGIFSGSGVGKSTLLGMMAKGTDADVNVIALIGERGREVKEFIEADLGEEGLKKSVVVVVTSDLPALMRIKGAYTATSIAEYFRSQGKSVLLIMDSITRFAMAQREIGLSLGEPPTTKGYTPSIFGLLPNLLERAGMDDKGSITAFYSVLVDADDFNEPISDACRSILDGHIILNRRLASLNHYPAIDILESISRLSVDVATEEQLNCAKKIKEVLAVYEEARDLINIGAYVKGSNPSIDYAIEKIEKINQFLIQNLTELFDFQTTLNLMIKIFEK